MIIVPTIYSALLQKSVEAVNNGQLLFNKNYQGDISKIGDKVKIADMDDPRIQDYTAGVSLTIDSANLENNELAINQAKGWTQRIENFDIESSQVNIPTSLIEKGGMAFGRAIDRYLISTAIAGVSPANTFGSVASPTEINKDNVLDVLGEVISTVYDRGVTGTVNVLIPSLVAQYIPAIFKDSNSQPELLAMGIKQGFQVDGANVYQSPITKQYLVDITVSGDIVDGAIGFTDNSFDVDSGANIEEGSIIQIDNELMYVSSIDSTTVTVERGFHFTDKAPHADNSVVKVMKESNLILATDPTTFGAFAQKAQRLRVIDQIAGQDAVVVQSFCYYGAKVLNGLAGGVSYVKKKTS